MRLTPLVFLSTSAAFAGMLAAPSQCLADWPKTIECPSVRVYRDIRDGGGRDEFCELLLPGSLKVRDGPSRSWYSERHLGEEGSYEKGRKVGRWKECDRFDRCHDQTYELLSPQERARGVKPDVPVSYSSGKYIFDFGSCWSTWVTRQTDESFLELNIGAGPNRCQITYIPSVERDRPAGSVGIYLCEVPHSVGVRAFDTLDLRMELRRLGLPQFCRKDTLPPTQPEPDGPAAQAFALWVKLRVHDDRTGRDVSPWTTLANIVDVECAAIDRLPSRRQRLTLRLNRYAEQLVLDRLGKDEMKADTCGRQLPLSTLGATLDGSGRTLFTYALSTDRTSAERQRGCIEAQIGLQAACGWR